MVGFLSVQVVWVVDCVIGWTHRWQNVGHTPGSHSPLTALTLPGAPASFLPRSPMAAMTAKYWMTLLVFTVFPAPDSPLKVAKESNGWIVVLWC